MTTSATSKLHGAPLADARAGEPDAPVPDTGRVHCSAVHEYRRAAYPLALLAMLVTSTSGASSFPSPEVGYTLQTRVYLQGDPEAKASLEVLGSRWVPSERIDWQPVIDDVPAWLEKQAFPPPSPAVGHAFAQALSARLPTIHCEARHYLPLGSPEFGMFALACNHPDVSPLREDYLALLNAAQRDAQAQSDALFSRWATVLRDAPDSTRCTPVTGWYLGSREATDGTRAEQLSRIVLMGLLPVGVWEAGEEETDTSGLCEVE